VHQRERRAELDDELSAGAGERLDARRHLRDGGRDHVQRELGHGVAQAVHAHLRLRDGDVVGRHTQERRWRVVEVSWWAEEA
jgi:hypothetical protein